MKFTPVAKANKKAVSILGILFLMFLSSGCFAKVGHSGQRSKCNKAEEAVQEAQKQSDDAIKALAKTKNETTSKNVALTLRTLQEAEQNAFEMCNPASSSNSPKEP